MDINTSDILALMETDDRFKHKIESIKSTFASKLDTLSMENTTINPTKDLGIRMVLEDIDDGVVSIYDVLTDLTGITKRKDAKDIDSNDSIYDVLTELTGITKRKDAKDKFFDSSNQPTKDLANTSNIIQLPKGIDASSPDKLIGGLINTLFGKSVIGSILPMLVKALPFAAIIGGILHGVFDGILGYLNAENWGTSEISASIAGFFAGTSSGWSGAGTNALKGGAIGGGVGMIVGGPVGAIVGAILGVVVGGILGFIGGEAIAQYIDNSVVALYFRDTMDTLNDNSLNLGGKFTKILLGAPLYEFLTEGKTDKLEAYSNATLGDDLYNMLADSNIGGAEKFSRLIIGDSLYKYLNTSDDSFATKLSVMTVGSTLTNLIKNSNFGEKFSRFIIGDEWYDFLIDDNVSNTKKIMALVFGGNVVNAVDNWFNQDTSDGVNEELDMDMYYTAMDSKHTLDTVTIEDPMDIMSLQNNPMFYEVDTTLVTQNKEIIDQNDELIRAIGLMSDTLSLDLKTLPSDIADKIPEVSGDTFNSFSSQSTFNQSSTNIPDYRNIHLK